MSPALAGQVAVVTGASRGFGEAYARALAAEGAAVALVARSAAVLERLAAERVAEVLGPIDMLLNVAGVGGPIGPFAESDSAAWWQTVSVNLGGAAHWAHAVLPSMLARGLGRIINVASGAGTRAIPYLSAYVTSKAALIRFSEVLAAEVSGRGVKVFAIEPGTARTGMVEEALTGAAGRRWTPWFADIFARGQDVTPEHSARFVVRLARGEADALTGRFLTVHDDLARLSAQAEAIVHHDQLVLRLTRPGTAT